MESVHSLCGLGSCPLSSASRSLFAELPPSVGSLTKLLEGWTLCPPDSLAELWAALPWNAALSLSCLRSRWTPLRVCVWVCTLVCVCGWVGVRAQSCLTLGARAVAYGCVCVCVCVCACSVVSDSLWWNSGVWVCACVCVCVCTLSPVRLFAPEQWRVCARAQSCLTLCARAVAYGCVCVCVSVCELSCS